MRSPYYLLTSVLLFTFALPSSVRAVALAEHYDSSAVTEWENNGMPQRMWFTVAYSRAHTIYTINGNGPEDRDVFSLFNSDVNPQMTIIWGPTSNNVDPVLKEILEYDLTLCSIGAHEAASSFGSSFVDETYDLFNGATVHKIQTGWWRAWPESVCYAMYGAGSEGASGEAKLSYLISDSSGAYQTSGESTATFTWAPDEFASSEINGSTFPETQSGNLYITSWWHP